MSLTNNLESIIARQKELVTDIEAEYRIIENSDLTKENDILTIELEKAKQELSLLKEVSKKTVDENASLKNALYEQLYNEKIKILNQSKQKLEVYFKAPCEGEIDRLSALEQTVRKRIDAMTERLRSNNIDLKDDAYQQLHSFSSILNEKIAEARETAKHVSTLTENEEDAFERLKNEQITARMVTESAKKNNMESFVGLNLINKLGILLIIVGVIAAGRYTFFRIPDMLKGIMMFALGACMLLAGEWLNRKKATVFSLGITSGGVAVLYVSLATCYFGLHILTQYPAIGLCILITAVAFILATRYNAQIILAFALVGGYLPMFSIQSGGAIVYGAMIYFVALNLLALFISFEKKWTIASYIGLILNIFGSNYIVWQSYNKNKYITILYVMFAFLVYTFIPIISTYKAKQCFKKPEIILLGINTFFSSVLMYWIFAIYGLTDFDGVLAITFAAIYLALGWFIEVKFTDEKNAQSLFYLTGFTFVVLVVPFQFGPKWLSLGWLAEGVSLATYGILRKENGFKKVGLVICGLCLAAFVMIDMWWGGEIFAYKYFAITLGSLIVLGAYIYKKALFGTFEKIYTYVTVINLWIYSFYVITVKLHQLMSSDLFNSFYICQALAIVVTFFIAFFVPRIKILCDSGIKIITMVIYAINILMLMMLNTVASPLRFAFTEVPFMYGVVGTLILVVLALLSVLVLYDLMKGFVLERKLGVEWFPLIVSGYFVLILTQNLITQYDLRFSNAVISIIYVVTALAWIVLGFVKRYAFLRRFGLGLAVLAVVKLFLIDLHSLTKGYQIISYFVLGITLVVISFVYQYFSKRLELTINVEEDK